MAVTVTGYLSLPEDDSKELKVLQGAFVRLVDNGNAATFDSTVATDASGYFAIAGVPASVYTLWSKRTAASPWTVSSNTSFVVSDPFASAPPAVANITGLGPGQVPIGTAGAPVARALVVGDVAGALANPMTTPGDLIVGGAAGAATQYAAGASGLVLTANGVGVAPTWQAAAGGAVAPLTLTGTTGVVPLTVNGIFGAATGIVVNPSTASGLLQDWQVASASKAKVDIVGKGTFTGGLAIGTAAAGGGLIGPVETGHSGTGTVTFFGGATYLDSAAGIFFRTNRDGTPVTSAITAAGLWQAPGGLLVGSGAALGVGTAIQANPLSITGNLLHLSVNGALMASIDPAGKFLTSAGMGLWGHAAPAAKPAAPVTLADLIALVQSYGMSA